MITIQSGGTGSLAAGAAATITLSYPAGFVLPPTNNTPQNLPAVQVSVSEVGAVSGACLAAMVTNIGGANLQARVVNVGASPSGTFVVTATFVNTPGQAVGI